MQLIRLDPAAAQLHAILLTYDPDAHLPGEIRPGRFLLDPQIRADRPIGLSLPPALRGRFRSEVRDSARVVVADRSQSRAPDLAKAVADYRARKTGSFERSTSEDRAFLEDLVRHPEQRKAPLSWGLRHYVCGDLVFDDGSVVTLDELCARAGLAPLPLLESIPDELDIPLDEDSP